MAFDLVEYAREHAEEQVEAVEAEIDAYLATHPVTPPDIAQLLELARRHLPAELYRQVERATLGRTEERGVTGLDQAARRCGGRPAPAPPRGDPFRAARPESKELLGLVDRGATGSEPELATLGGHLPVMVTATRGAWSRVVSSNSDSRGGLFSSGAAHAGCVWVDLASGPGVEWGRSR